MELSCYGKKYGRLDQCRVCEYVEYCRTAKDPDTNKRVSHSVRLDKGEYFIEQNDFTTSDKSAHAFASMLTYLISLDDTTASMICEVIDNPNIRQAQLAKKRGVSRQRINTTLLHICRSHPELKSLFKLCVNRLTLARNRYKHHKPTHDSTPQLPGLEEGNGAGQSPGGSQSQTEKVPRP